MIISCDNNILDGVTYLLIVIETDNLARMEKADPITLISKKLGGALPPLLFTDVRIVIAYEKEPGPLYAMCKRNAPTQEMIRYVERNYQHSVLDGIHKLPDTDPVN